MHGNAHPMRILPLIRKFISAQRLIGGAAFSLLFASPLPLEAASPLAFTVRVNGDQNVPRITVRNESRVPFTRLQMTIGDTSKNFDAAYHFAGPPGGSISRVSPDDNDGGGSRSDTVILNISGFDPGESIAFDVDIDKDSE